jgi:hypothetical protein
MAAVSNPRHEIFAHELAKGKTADEAYQLAGYKSDRGNAARLTANDSVRTRVSELLGRAANRAEVTVESLIAEAEEVRRLAIERGQLSAAIAAIKEKGVLSGKRSERAESGQPGAFDRMSEAELEQFILEGSEAIKKHRDLH